MKVKQIISMSKYNASISLVCITDKTNEFYVSTTEDMVETPYDNYEISDWSIKDDTLYAVVSKRVYASTEEALFDVSMRTYYPTEGRSDETEGTVKLTIAEAIKFHHLLNSSNWYSTTKPDVQSSFILTLELDPAIQLK